jgi:hypothetical protein
MEMPNDPMQFGSIFEDQTIDPMSLALNGLKKIPWMSGLD